MTDEQAQFAREGDNPFAAPNTAEETAADSQSEEETATDTQSDEGENTRNEQHDRGFADHPRWKEREDAWNAKFNDQERRHQDDLKAIREEFGQARKENREQTKIPSWFGGNQEQWDAYRTDRDAELKSAKEDAEKAAYDRLTSEKGAEEKAVKDATDFMKAELTAIESDKTLNPTGAKIDPNKLLKIVLDNQLIDTSGRWNYRAGWQILRTQTTASPKPNVQEKKEVAASTTSESRAENKPKTYKTSNDFKKNRPW